MRFTLPVRTLLASALVTLAAHAPVYGSSIIVPSDARLLEKSDLVVIGRVLATEPFERGGRIWTESTIVVEDRLMGTSPAVVTVRQRGGELDGRLTVIWGSPALAAAERVLLFLTADGDAYRIIDLAAGKFSEKVDREGTRFWIRDLGGADIDPIGSAGERGGLQRIASAFERSLRNGAPEEDAYRFPYSPPAREEIASHFALVSEPRVQRWFAFEDGDSAGWAASGSQGGYPGGGHHELAGAIMAWTSCPETRIDYSFVGASTAPAAGTRVANGVNEVFFDDPLDEIRGSWNGRDGVVAVGGFDAVLVSRPWRAGPTGDASHPPGESDAWVIVEADVVVQDGIAPSAGVGSMMLAEILAHELGHTLGFGHSADPRALMYASLQNLGPYLRDDDRRAAQWLYPGARDAAPEALDAPSNLSIADVTSESVRLAWRDNARGETIQTIYARRPGEPFAKLRDVAADVTVANLPGLAPGREYEFQVTARGPALESPPSNIAVAAVPWPSLESAFHVGPPAGTAGITTFSLYDQSKGMIASRAWTFGDGTGSTAPNPTHVYREAGTFEITLRVRDERGEETIASRTVRVAAPPALAADFVWHPERVLAGGTVRLVDRSAGAPTSWRWSFGDGTVSSERDATVRFDEPGRYVVALEVADGLQTSRTTHSIDVHGDDSARSGAGFSFAPAAPAAGQIVRFAADAAEADRWTWDFGDGTSASTRAPSHAFEHAGTYLVALEVARGAASARSTVLLVVRDAGSSDPIGSQAIGRTDRGD